MDGWSTLDPVMFLVIFCFRPSCTFTNYSCLSASGAVSLRDEMTAGVWIHGRRCQYYDNVSFHSPWFVPWLIARWHLRQMGQWEWFSSWYPSRDSQEAYGVASWSTWTTGRVAGALVTLQGEEQGSKCTEVTLQRDHLTWSNLKESVAQKRYGLSLNLLS